MCVCAREKRTNTAVITEVVLYVALNNEAQCETNP